MKFAYTKDARQIDQIILSVDKNFQVDLKSLVRENLSNLHDDDSLDDDVRVYLLTFFKEHQEEQNEEIFEGINREAE